MWELFGFIASFCFITCGLPQVLLCIRQGHGDGVSKGFIWIWFLGELALLFYASLALAWNLPLLLNAIFCSLICLIILNYIYFPKKKRNPNLVTNLFIFKRVNS